MKTPEHNTPYRKTVPAVLAALMVLWCAAGVLSAQVDEAPKIYVPYEDVAAVVSKSDRSVLMDRAEFNKLLAAAKTAADKAALTDNIPKLGQITRGDYSASVSGENLTLKGQLTIRSLIDGPVVIELPFTRIGLTEILLDGKPAPANYNSRGRLVLIVSGSGLHKLTLVGSARLTELSGGGMQFSMSLPTSVSGAMKLQLPGDQEAHANVPVAAVKYDKKNDRTIVDLTLGGYASLSVALLGNGRQEDQKAILLGESATTVALTPTGQTMDCLYTVQVLRRQRRELVFALAPNWTITDVSCPSLVRWSVARPKPNGAKELTVRLRSAARGTRALHIRASAPMGETSWSSPAVSLVGAGYQRGYVLVDPGEQLAVRGETLKGARRQDIRGVSQIAGMTGSAGRLYFHWGDKWSVALKLAQIQLQTRSKDNQAFVISPKELTAHLSSEITAVGREMFAMDFMLPGSASGWDLISVTVNGSKKGFEYRTIKKGPARVLKLELASPVAPEAVAKVNVMLRRVPSKWNWSSAGGASQQTVVRKITLPLISSAADKCAGLATVSVAGDLDAKVSTGAEGLKAVTVGKMAFWGLGRAVRSAYTYEIAPSGQLEVSVSRPEPRIAASGVGLVSVSPAGVSGRFAVTYNVTRVGTRTLYLLSDKSLGNKLTIRTPGRQLASRSIVSPGADTLVLPKSVSEAYDLWQLKLDAQARGPVLVRVSYQQALPEEKFSVPMIRPAGVERSTEVLAIEGAEELAVNVSASSAADVDITDLPPLPAPARRVLGAFRAVDNTNADGPLFGISLTTAVHENYAIPSALVTSAELRTVVGSDGSQQTRAKLQVVNAGLQFLTIKLPGDSKLLSVRVARDQAKLKRDASGAYQVSIPQGRKTLDVLMVYSTPPTSSDLGDLKLVAVQLPGLQINTAKWTVIPPTGFTITDHESNMSPERPEMFAGPPLAAASLFRSSRHRSKAQMYSGINYFHVDSFSLSDSISSLIESTVSINYGYDLDAGSLPRVREAHDESISEGEDLGGPAAVIKRSPPVTRPSETPQPPTPKKPKPGKKDSQWATRSRTLGRHTLPVDLVESMSHETEAVFSGLGGPQLTISLTPRSVSAGHQWMGLAIVGLLGLLILNARVWAKVKFIILAGAATVLVALWAPFLAHGANGGFYAVCLLVLVYPLVGLWRLIARGVIAGRPVVQAAAMLAIAAAFLAMGQTAHAGAKPDPLIIPYDGDPQKAVDAGKVLLPYKRYVKLWNLANPDQKIKLPSKGLVSGLKISLAGVTYDAVVADKKMNITLTADITARGDGWAVLPMDISGMAVTTATLNGKPAGLQVGPKGMVLAVKAPVSGKFVLTGLTTPKYVGSKGSVYLSLPLLPLAVMKVRLDDANLELEAPGIDGVLTSRKINTGVEWTVPLGSARKLALRWSPKAGSGAADRTLSVTATHSIGVFHWALVGASKMSYSFPAGQNDRFELLVPQGAKIMKISGANLRDHRIAGVKTIEGRKFNVVDVRLYRPADKRYELTANWIGDLPPIGAPSRLWLPRAGRVGREAGYVHIRTAGGMVLKVTDVQGGRRRDIASPSGKSKGAATTLADSTATAASYQWPYRDFSIHVQISRRQAVASVNLDQLVRVNADRVQLMVQASINPAGKGGKGGSSRFFGAAFNLPDNYELLSVVGPDVEGWHVQKASDAKSRRIVHVGFRTAVVKSQVSMVLVRDDAKVERLSAPMVQAVDPDGRVIENQSGRLAVQIAPALDAHTVSSKLLTSIAPSASAGWLSKAEVRAVQFAYRYFKPGASLELAVRERPTKVRVEVVAGISVHPASAAYTYRLRYNVSGSPIDQVSFTLPAKYAQLTAVTSRYMRSVASTDAPAGRKKWTVSLTNELTGQFDLLVNFTLPIDAATRQLPAPRIVTGAPDGYRAILAVQNTSRHELAFTPSKSMTPLPVAVQKQVLGSAVSKSLQYVYQSFEDDWSAQLSVTPAKTASRIQAIIDLMELRTVIDKSGQCRYQADLSLHNRSEQFLKIKLPAGLQLWSARVAGQAVKPVLPSGASGGDMVHVPLVKTSRGGLPYNVKLYFAGKSSDGVSGISRISAPSIRVVGIPIKQSTWSLRLPKGFRYIRPEGNMSPIAGTAERLSIGIDAKLSQLKRTYKSYVSSPNTVAQEKVFQKNWQVSNDELVRQVAGNQKYLDDNRGELGEADYQRLTSKLNTISAGQFNLNAKWNANPNAQVDTASNVNHFLNGRVVDQGLMEVERNKELAKIPEFVRNAGRLQLTNIQSEYAGNVTKLANRRNRGKGKGRPKGAKTGKSKPQSGFAKDSLLALEDRDKDGELKEVAEALAGEQERLLVMRQDQLQKQVRDLGDNRLERYFNNINPHTVAQTSSGTNNMPGQGQGQGGQQELAQVTNVDPDANDRSFDGQNFTAGGLNINGGSIITTNNGAIVVNGGGTLTVPGTDGTYVVDVAGAERGRNGRGGGGGGGGFGFDDVGGDGDRRTAPGGMFSLPVQLPDSDGEVLDFAYPGGDPEVSLLAVPLDIWTAGRSSIAVLIVLLTIALFAAVISRISSRSRRVAA